MDFTNMNPNSRKEICMENIFDILVKNAMNERLDKIVNNDDILCRYERQFDELGARFDRIKLNIEDKKIINAILDVQIAQSSRYAELAYKQAVFDTISLLKTMKIIPESIS